MMTPVRKAVITAAGRGTRQYPATNTVQKELFPLVDVDGYAKPTLQIIAEEAVASGIQEICVVANTTNAEPIRQHFHGLTEAQRAGQFAGKDWAWALSDALDDLARRLTVVVQAAQEGYGHAVYQAREWVGDEPCVVLLGDHVYRSHTDERCARQVIAAYEQYDCPVSSVARTPESLITRLGTVAGRPLGGTPPVYEVAAMTEKPAVEEARARLRTPGLADGEYLCFFGIHVFPPAIFDCLEHLLRHDIRRKGEFQLTSAQALLFERGRYLVSEVQGERYDMGVPEGLIETQIALALDSPYRKQAIALLSHAPGGIGD
ncbi:MAG: NTP transferase domain-containing protein [Armatimonadetes bacterium]|nr:NTP transferase domain-containing protein [Armatimonadota bacterium]